MFVAIAKFVGLVAIWVKYFEPEINLNIPRQPKGTGHI